MKHSIQLIALFAGMSALLTSTAVLAADTHPVRATTDNKITARTTIDKRDLISLNTLENNRGVKVSIKKQDMGTARVTIYDAYGNVILNDRLPEDLFNEKNYILQEDGVYIFVITSHHERVRKTIEVGHFTQETISVKN